MVHGSDIDALVERLESRLQHHHDESLGEILADLTELYGRGLGRLMHHLQSSGVMSETLSRALEEDPAVAALLSIHNLRLLPLEARVEQALLSVRPQLAAHGGGVELLEITEGPVARLRLRGSCDGCGASQSTLERLVWQAVAARAPEILEIVTEASKPQGTTAPPSTELVQLGTRANTAVRCELCSEALGQEHRHVLDRDTRSLRCACVACALLFEKEGAGRYATIPRRIMHDPQRELTAAQWSQLGVPVYLAFAIYNSHAGRWFGIFPSPGGPVEADLDEQRWREVCGDLELVREIQPDVEALVVHGARGAVTLEYFLAPVSDCYELVGALRQHWRGFDGGDEGRRIVEGFFATLRSRSRPVTAARANG